MLAGVTRLAGDHAQTIEETLIRYLGVLEEELNDVSKKLRNPLTLFTDGIQFFLLLPIYILKWFGLLGASSIRFFSRNVLFRFLSSLIGLLGFLSSVVGLVVGWNDFLRIAKSFFGL